MQIVDRRRQTQHIKADEIGHHQRQCQHIKRIKPGEARLHEKAGRDSPVTQSDAIGVSQHEAAESKKQINGEIARGRIPAKKLLGMAMDDKERGHAPYAVKQDEAFRG